MSEEDLRIQQIKMKIKGLTFEQARDISNLCSEYYIEGLEQSRFDKNMLEQENTQLKEAIKRCYTPEEIDFEIMPVKAELEAEKDINNNLHKTIDKLRVNLYETQQENTHLKSVLKEIRDFLEKNKFAYVNPFTQNIYNVSRCDEVLEIIDKGIGEDK